MKNISQIKIFVLLTIALLSLEACSKDADDSKPDDTKGVVNEDVAYSSFEVNLPENHRSIGEGAYATFGVKPSIRFSVNEDNTLDTYWEGELSPTADGHRHLSKISLTSQSIVSEIPFPQQVNLGNTTFLGYEYLGNDRYIMGASEVNQDEIQRKKPIYYCFDHTGKVKYTIDFWKDYTDNAHATARAGQAIIVYNKKIDNFGIYLARRGTDSHQAGNISFHDAATGNRTFFRPWYISHNFDQRLLPMNDGRYLASGHGDDFPQRGLLIETWKFNDNPTNRTWSNAFPFPGISGANITNSGTGDILELPNGNIAVLYTTQRDFTTSNTRRDLRLSIFSNVGEAKNSAVKVKDVWLTSYQEAETAGWGAQMAHYSQGKIFIAWNVFDHLKDTKVLKSSLAIVDYNGTMLSKKDIALPSGNGDNNSRLVQSGLIIRTTNDGKNLVFISEGSAKNKLRVNLVAINK